MNRELPDVQASFRKGRGTRDQIANICWIIEKAREFQKNIYYCLTDYAKSFDCVDHNKLWKFLKSWEYHHLTCFLRNLYAGQGATVRTGHGTMDLFQIGKRVHQGFGIVNKVEVDVFLELSCFFYDSTDVGYLISGSSAFSKPSLNIWKFTVHIQRCFLHGSKEKLLYSHGF